MADPLRQQPCYHKYKDNFNISLSLISFKDDSSFQTNLQNNYSEKNDERHNATSAEMQMTSVIRLHSKLMLITPSHIYTVKDRCLNLFTFIWAR